MPTAVATVQLRNPDPKKKGPRMAKTTYAVVRKAALATLSATAPGMTLAEFRAALAKRLDRTKGWDPTLSAQWYGMAIKLDLEARGELKRSGTPQRLTRA
jgi:Xaa-Pro aminopeptidase